MTPGIDVPARVLRFIEQFIDTVPQLETLLMMSREESRDWLVHEVGARNYISEQRAAETLEALRRRGLVSSDDTRHQFRFSPANPETRELVGEVGRYYQMNLSYIAMFIHAKPSASIQEFARAFDLKKER